MLRTLSKESSDKQMMTVSFATCSMPLMTVEKNDEQSPV
jgi:hypothetical protein